MSMPILVVEDHPSSLELVSYLLQSAGYQTVEASDGPQALQLAGRESPCLVICDLQLPTLSGLNVARRLRSDAELCRIPLVAVTAFSMVDDMVVNRRTALDVGFDGFIQKPIEPERFVEQIEAFLPEDVRRGPPGDRRMR